MKQYNGLLKILELARDRRIPRTIIINDLIGIVEVLQKQLVDMQTKWDKHLKDEGGSCYCLASDTSCLPERIKEIKEILG